MGGNATPPTFGEPFAGPNQQRRRVTGQPNFPRPDVPIAIADPQGGLQQPDRPVNNLAPRPGVRTERRAGRQAARQERRAGGGPQRFQDEAGFATHLLSQQARLANRLGGVDPFSLAEGDPNFNRFRNLQRQNLRFQNRFGAESPIDLSPFLPDEGGGVVDVPGAVGAGIPDPLFPDPIDRPGPIDLPTEILSGGGGISPEIMDMLIQGLAPDQAFGRDARNPFLPNLLSLQGGLRGGF